jgi:hypothetical protein
MPCAWRQIPAILALMQRFSRVVAGVVVGRIMDRRHPSRRMISQRRSPTERRIGHDSRVSLFHGGPDITRRALSLAMQDFSKSYGSPCQNGHCELMPFWNSWKSGMQLPPMPQLLVRYGQRGKDQADLRGVVLDCGLFVKFQSFRSGQERRPSRGV